MKRALKESVRSLVMAETRAAALQSENDTLKLQLQQFYGTDIQIERPLALSEKDISDNLFPLQAPNANNDKDDLLGSMIYNSIRAKKIRAEADRVDSHSPEDRGREPPRPANNELVRSSVEMDNPAGKITSRTSSPYGQAGKGVKTESSGLMLVNLQRDILASPAPIIARNASKTSKVQKSEGKTARALPNLNAPHNDDRNAPHHKLKSGDEILDYDAIAKEILDQTSVVPHRPMMDELKAGVYTCAVGGKSTTSERFHLPIMKRPFEEGREPQKICYKRFRMSGREECSGDRAKNGVSCQGSRKIEGGPVIWLCKREGCINQLRRKGLCEADGGKDSTDASHKSSTCSANVRNLGNADGPFGTSMLTNTMLDTKDTDFRFPFKLYAMLESATNSVHRRAVSWSSSGRSFIIYDEVAFMQHLVPRHFKLAKFPSFLRNLYLWGFKSMKDHAWHHKHFARGNIEGLKFIHRSRQPNKPRQKGGKASERDMGVARVPNPNTRR